MTEGVRVYTQTSKCSFATTEIEYLGHTLTPVGLRPDNTKITATKEYYRPQKAKQVKSFFGSS